MSDQAPEFLAFDLSPMRDWPEMAALTLALDALARRAGREGGMSQIEFERALGALSRALVASDCCKACQRSPVAAYVPCPPYALRVEGSGVLGSYRCAAGHEWDCRWAGRSMLLGVLA